MENLTRTFNDLTRTADESAAVFGRFSSLLTWLIEAGELVPDDPELELTLEDHSLLAGMKIAA
jgi:hypothetical protein